MLVGAHYAAPRTVELGDDGTNDLSSVVAGAAATNVVATNTIATALPGRVPCCGATGIAGEQISQARP
jgi:hypothetical protein